MRAAVRTGAETAGSVMYRSPSLRYPSAVAANGMTITDSSGRNYLDMSGGAAVSILGHGDSSVIAAVRSQLETMAYAHTAFFTNQPQEQLATRLVRHFGDPHARVYFSSGGSEANETALKLAWQFWATRGAPQKQVIISREHSYHGNTFGTLSVSGNAARRRASAAPLLDWPRIAPCYALRNRTEIETEIAYSTRAANELEEAIQSRGAENIAAFICEPIVGSSLGVVPATSGYLRRIRDICDRHDILFIADEIMSGSGRSGSFFAHQYDGARPDIVTLAKGLGGGYQPLAATVLNGKIAQQLGVAGFAHGHTYIGHPLACAAGFAVLQAMDERDLLKRTEQMGVRLQAILRDKIGDHPNVADIRGRGLFAGIELVADRQTLAGFEGGRALPELLRIAAMSEGLIVYPGGIEVDGRTVPHILLAPPMIVEEQHIEECAEALLRVFDETLPV